MNAKHPIVSVLMSVYSEPIEWIDYSVKSIQNQTLSDFEFIIVNDNPESDQLRSYLDELAKSDARIRILVNAENKGLTKSLNVGMKQCHGKYIARMDADDWAYPNRLERQVDFMEKNPDLIASSAFAYSWDGKDSLKEIYRPASYEDIISYTFTSSPFIHPLLIMRREVLKSAGLGYDERFLRSQDYKLAIDLLQVGKIANLPEYLLKYRISEQQITSKYGNQQVELCKAIRRRYVSDFYIKYNLKESEGDLSFRTIRYSKNLEKSYLKTASMDRAEILIFKRSMNSIRRLYYYSMADYSIRSFWGFIFSGDYFFYPYNLRRFMVVLTKHIKSNIVPSLL